MGFRPVIVALSAGLCFSGVAKASDWQIVGKTKEAGSVLLDRQSVQWADDLATFWTRLDNPNTTTTGGGSYMVQLSCSTGLYRISVSPGTVTTANPFGKSDSSPYAFQPANTGVPSMLRGRVCALRPVAAPAYRPPTLVTPPKPPPVGRIPGPPLDQ
jgi:hypothetical protein